MGSICGIVCPNNTHADPNTLATMSASMAHRGPDHRGVIVHNNIALGCIRLNIIHLQNAQQPLANEDGSVLMVMNGEIYNHHNIRKALQARGHRFRSLSGSETVLHGYEEWGPQILNRLNGVFVMAIWDHKDHSLFLARDRLGVKSLYYQYNNNRFLFASEIKAILAGTRQGHRLNPKSLYDWFAFSFIPTPRTMFQEILKVPPGYCLLFKNSQIHLQQYWDISFPIADTTPSPRPLEDWCEEFRCVLTAAVKDRMQADMPVAAFLSGGLDSSTVVALASCLNEGTVSAFSIEVASPDYPDMNETAYQQAVAKKYGLERFALLWRQEYYDLIEKALWHAEFPVLGNYSIPLLILSEAVRQKGFKVVLTGDGADENLAGYPGFQELKLLKTCMKKDIHGQTCLRHRKHLLGTSLEHYSRPCARSRSAIENLFMPHVRSELLDYDPYADLQFGASRLHAWHYLNQAIYLENKLILPNLWTPKVDKICMANGVEPRLPFLDHRVVEFLATVPPHLKLNHLTEKYLLRKTMSDILPRGVLSRRKHGLMTPIINDPSIYINTDRGQDLLSTATAQRIGLFSPDAIQRLQSNEGAADSQRLCAICCVHLFCDKFSLTY
jgi:asparagine synthase (glutamine-hydrolysing)